MKKATILIALLFVTCISVYAQPANKKPYTITDYKGTFIFDENYQLKGCDDVGKNVSDSLTTIYQGSLFKVVYINPTNGDLVIQFFTWTIPSKVPTDTDKLKAYNLALKKRETFNFKQNADKNLTSKNTPKEIIRYFLLTQNDKAAAVSAYTPDPKYI